MGWRVDAECQIIQTRSDMYLWVDLALPGIRQRMSSLEKHECPDWVVSERSTKAEADIEAILVA